VSETGVLVEVACEGGSSLLYSRWRCFLFSLRAFGILRFCFVWFCCNRYLSILGVQTLGSRGLIFMNKLVISLNKKFEVVLCFLVGGFKGSIDASQTNSQPNTVCCFDNATVGQPSCAHSSRLSHAQEGGRRATPPIIRRYASSNRAIASRK
jgi:hypothetical protein